MESINAQTIIAAILAAARVAPEYPDAAIVDAMPQGVPYGFEIVPDWDGTACRTYPPSSQYHHHNLAIERIQDAARAELRAMLDIPVFVRIRTSERGSMRIVNTSARLNQFAATVRTNARAFGGGLAPARKAPAAIKAWPAGPVKLVAELLQDNMPADAAALALQRCGASFYDTGKGAFMVWAPMPVEGLPDGLISVRSSASGRYVVQCSKSGFPVGSTGATRRAAEESARQAVADAGPEKTAAAMAAARPCDIDAARAAWFKTHGIDAAAEVAEVADMSESATPEPVADVAAEVSAFVASLAAIADAMQGPADAAPAVNPEPVAELAGHGAEVAPMMAGQAVASMPAAGGLADAGGSGPGWPAGPAAGRRVAGGSDAGPEDAEPVGITGTRGNTGTDPEPVGMARAFGVDANPHTVPQFEPGSAMAWIVGAVCQVACAMRIPYRAAGILAAPFAAKLAAERAAGGSVHDGARIVLEASAGPSEDAQPAASESAPADVAPVAQPVAIAEPGADALQPVGISDHGQGEPEPVEIPDYVGTGTYSPEDNKLRLYPFSRLDAATYARVKAAGFAWAPKQEVFVAPMWTPGRADLLAELVGQIEDEDGTMRERAADRADRFEDYQGKRAADAERARDAVQSIGARFELGQPILIGHHSQRKAEKDKERMESGMRKAVQAWETSQYWERRAAACVRHALYKERPDVRARRIKGLESDLRKQERQRAAAVAGLARWEAVEIADKWKARADGTKPDRLERARTVAGLEHVGMYTPEGRSYAYSAYDVLQPDGERYADCESWTVDQVLEQVRRAYPIMIEWSDRWIQHYRNRIAYERAMLADAGGTVADKVGPEVGGACKCWASPRGGGWSTIQKVNRVSVTVLDNWGNGGADFTRTMPLDKLTAIMSRAQVDQARADGRIIEETARGFHLLAPTPATPAADPVEIAQPVPDPAPEVAPAQPVENVAPDVEAPQEAPEPVQAVQASPKPARLDAAPFQAMRQALKSGGVQAVAVPQLFATPAALAARMVELAQLSDGDRVLEPSAGTGRIVDAIAGRGLTGMIVAVEVSRPLADSLRARFETYSRPGLGIEVHAADFLQDMAIGRFDAVIMNPPFIGGADIKHIKRALQYLKPGGRLVAICAGGPRQAAELRPMVDAMGGTWEPLPADTFRESGTGVNTVLLCVDAPDVARQDPPEPVAKPAPLQPVKVADYRPAADLDAQLLAMRAAEAGPVPESLESLLRRYAAVRLVLYRASMQDERSAQIATQFACDDLMTQYRRTLREGGHEVDALAYVRMEAEDMERAARNAGLQTSVPSASTAEPEPDPEAAPAVTIEAMHAFLALHYRPDRFTDRDGPTWGARYSWEVARSALEHLAKHGHGQIGHHETRTGLSIHYDAALQVFDDAAMDPTTATAGQVQAWSARHFRAVLYWLEDMNHHGEALLIRALRAGSSSLAASVRALIRDHLAAGYLRPELAAKRNDLAARVQALEAGH